MKYHFLGKVVFEDGSYEIKIPFIVWEVCTGQGSFPVEVTAEGKEKRRQKENWEEVL